MKSFYLTDSGKVRSHNEDSVVIIKNKNNEHLLAVADGMGGHKAGEVASSIAIDHLSHEFSNLDSVGTKTEAVKWLKENITKINDSIFEYTSKHPESMGMGTTLVTALLTDSFLLVGNIGDSSGYVIKEKQMHKVTYDHTLVNLLVTTGELTEEEAKAHPRRNVLMKALGAIDPVELDIFDIDMSIDGIMLCSDGLTNMLTDEQIERVLNDDELDIEDKLIKLIRKCNNRGGTDNISIAYLNRNEGETSDN